MNYYLGPMQWVTQTGSGYFRAPAGTVGMVDLRNLTQQSQAGVIAGVCLFATNGTLGSGYTLLGSGDLREIKTDGRMRSAWLSIAKYAAVGENLSDLLWDHLLNGGDPIGADDAKPLIPNNRRELELRLGGHGVLKSEAFKFGRSPYTNRIKAVLQADLEGIRALSESGKMIDPITKQVDSSYHRRVMKATLEKYRVGFDDLKPANWPSSDRPLAHRTTITESFNTSDGDTLGPDLSWTEVDGDWDIVSNRAQMVTNFGSTMRDARADSDLSSTDHYAKATRTDGVRISGVCSRFSSSAETAYCGYVRVANGTTGKVNVSKVVAGTLTSLADSADQNTSTGGDFVIKSESNGSTIRVLRDDVEQASLTDTAITTGTRCGICGYDPSGSGSSDPILDTFEAGDLGAGPSFQAAWARGSNSLVGA